MTESELRAAVVALAHKNGWRVFSLPIAKTRRPVKDAVGYPDLTLARRGVVLWFELKAHGGIVSPEQDDWLLDLGGGAHIIRPNNLDLVERLLA